MRKRTRKILSLLIAASMVCTMNTAVFAEEAVDVEAAPAGEDVIEVVIDEGAEVEAEAVPEETGEAETEADNDAAVNEADDAVIDAETAGTADVHYFEGIAYDKDPIKKYRC